MVLLIGQNQAWHSNPLVQPPGGNKSGLVLVFWVYKALVVGFAVLGGRRRETRSFSISSLRLSGFLVASGGQLLFCLFNSQQTIHKCKVPSFFQTHTTGTEYADFYFLIHLRLRKSSTYCLTSGYNYFAMGMYFCCTGVSSDKLASFVVHQDILVLCKTDSYLSICLATTFCDSSRLSKSTNGIHLLAFRGSQFLLFFGSSSTFNGFRLIFST